MDIPRLATLVVTLIHAAFDSYRVVFEALTRMARTRFESRDWHGAQYDAVARLALYKHEIDAVVEEVGMLLGDAVGERELWARARAAYARLVSGREDAELAETFFNSVTRRLFSTVGVDPQIEFVSVGTGGPERAAPPPVHRGYPSSGERGTAELVRAILEDARWTVGYEDICRDAALVAQVIDEAARRAWGEAGWRSIDILDSVFYRNKGAYIVGRICGPPGSQPMPLLLPLLNGDGGITVDAALTTEDEASIVFGFTWSYFHVEAPHPRAMVDFLRSFMPRKRIDELYTSIGFHKHGKTELYRSLLRHLEAPEARFEVAPGEPGLVMSVFTLPSFDVVFKIIKDAFGATKRTTRRAVMGKYQLVFVRDRVGRLADAQEFEHLAFRRSCFDEALLAELLRDAGRTVRVEGDRVIVRHLYTERRVTPLNLYIRDHADDAADAVLDYGNAIKELAAANIFAGDMLLKNFGVTRHGRVIFYDYDELCLLTDCQFRALPAPSNPDEEMAAEPWYFVGDNDVFPEEFASFLLPPGPLRETFLSAHADLLGLDFWREMQARQRAGEIVDVFPYRPSRRFVRP